MAFHVACPITCRRICFCSLGFPRGEKVENGFLEEIARLEEFLKDSSMLRIRGVNTVQVAVPKVVAPPPPPAVVVGNGCDAGELLLKRVATQRKAAAVSLEAEDYAPRFESGVVRDLAGEEQSQSSVKVMCRLCFSAENEGSERARKMLSCKSCGKKYHRLCLKAWAKHRDLFHWSSWTCPSCQICEVCRRTDDPIKFMFCKRCDGAYHCYCQQPPHKNVSNGPYLCPKHTKCHSCESTVPGNGLSVRWFLGYTCCDACGRLFVKGNYCPVCLKVYRDSELTPMVRCDVCLRWVHCQCDGISDEKYMQFQVDGNLQYKCASCRGECYQVRDLEDAVRELWLRRDEADRDLIASLRAAAGLPTEEEIFSISPYSDDEESGPTTLNNEYSRSLKFSLKGEVNKSPKKSKDYGKKSSNKKYGGKKKGHQTSLVSKSESQKFEGHSDNKSVETRSNRKREFDLFPSPVAGSLTLTEGVCSINQAGVSKHKFIDEVTAINENRTVEIKSNIGENASKSKTTKGPKLVIHLGAGNRTRTDSPMSVASSCQKEQDLTASNGSEDMGQQERLIHKKLGDGRGEKMNYSEHVKGSKLKGRESSMIKINKINPEVSDANPKFGLGKMGDLKYDPKPLLKDPKPLLKDPKPLLKLKFKNPYYENQSLWAPQSEDEKSSLKGQRSKRKRPSSSMEKTSAKEEDEDNTEGEIMDANWILQKLGKGAIGKRVEVHQPSNNSWHKGTVREVFEGTSNVSVALDDGGRSKILDLDKQGIRFASQKRKR